MELQIKPFIIPEVIEFNYQELEYEITKKSSDYANLIYADDQISEAKKDRASLNKFVKVLDDERKRIKKKCLEPYEDVDAKFKKLEGIVKTAISNVDNQVKEYEEKKKADKLEAIKDYWNTCKLPFPELSLEEIFDPKWLNASVSMKTVIAEIDTKLEAIISDLVTLSNLSEISFFAADVYKTTLDINKAISEGKRLAEMQKRKEEQERLKVEMEAKLEEPTETPKAKELVEEREWLAFRANLTVMDAQALANLFAARRIPFEQLIIQESEE